jgi:spore maturation protein CgeB
MRILYVAMKYDYGNPEWGFDYGHYNFFDTLRHMGNEILYFDFMTLIHELGHGQMNRKLLTTARKEKPDLMFTVMHEEELDRNVVSKITESTDTTTLNWFCDDHWRFDTFSRHWAPCFKYVVTTAASALPRYAHIGYRNVIKSQWGCNHFVYKKLDLPMRYEATFVGQPHGDRRHVISALTRAGFDVMVWGRGWEAGRISQDDMIRVFNQSRVNLNLSNASVPRSNMPLSHSLAKISKILPTHAKTVGKRLLSKGMELRPGRWQDRTKSLGWYAEQIKGRDFEVPGCGGFLLTGKAENLEEYYRIGREVVCFDDTDELIDKVEYYLSHEEERASIAQAGYERTLRDHTYVQRFNEIFKKIGLPSEIATDETRRRVVEVR